MGVGYLKITQISVLDDWWPMNWTASKLKGGGQIFPTLLEGGGLTAPIIRTMYYHGGFLLKKILKVWKIIENAEKNEEKEFFAVILFYHQVM